MHAYKRWDLPGLLGPGAFKTHAEPLEALRRKKSLIKTVYNAWMESNRSYLAFLSVLIPNWRFFDDMGAHPKVYFKLSTQQEWNEVFAPQKRHPWNLIFNPRGNLRLVSISAFERLLQESQDYLAKPEAFFSTQSYLLCLRILRDEVCLPPAASFQFKICAYLSEGSLLQDAFVSGVHHLDA